MTCTVDKARPCSLQRLGAPGSLGLADGQLMLPGAGWTASQSVQPAQAGAARSGSARSSPGCCLQLLIKGIRSFSPNNTVVVEFYRPLTLIVGQNGAGKTVTHLRGGACHLPLLCWGACHRSS